MNKNELLEKVRKGGYTTQELIGWIGAAPIGILPVNITQIYNGARKPIKIKVGDVLMHKEFKHPFVVLKVRKNYSLCVLLTSDATCSEVLEKCESRFFNDSYFTSILLTVKEPLNNSWMNQYCNNKQLNSVYTKLKKL